MENDASRNRFAQPPHSKSRDAEGAALLARFVAAPTDAEAEVVLGRLLGEYASALIRRVVARSSRCADGEDLIAETLAQLLARFRKLRQPGARPIENLDAYIATAAHHRCDERARKDRPGRARLAKRVRYLFRRRPGLAMWRAPSGQLLCGLRAGVACDPSSAPQTHRKSLAAIEHLVAEALLRQGEPMPFEALVNEVARASGECREPLEIPLDLALVGSVPLRDEALSIRDLWRDLSQLPRGQRVALMLNLRDPAAREPVSLVPLMETLTFPEIASMLNFSQGELAAVWDDVPLDDKRIAALLGVTRREVVKLRRLARERLWRRRAASARSQ